MYISVRINELVCLTTELTVTDRHQDRPTNKQTLTQSLATDEHVSVPLKTGLKRFRPNQLFNNHTIMLSLRCIHEYTPTLWWSDKQAKLFSFSTRDEEKKPPERVKNKIHFYRICFKAKHAYALVKRDNLQLFVHASNLAGVQSRRHALTLGVNTFWREVIITRIYYLLPASPTSLTVYNKDPGKKTGARNLFSRLYRERWRRCPPNKQPLLPLAFVWRGLSRIIISLRWIRMINTPLGSLLT